MFSFSSLCVEDQLKLLAFLQIGLVDFGATREYSKEFMDRWLHLLSAAAADDRDACVEWSLKLGYLTGEENKVCYWEYEH
jgi:predicted unusual protein kinase regulating ubiquinone biosynthesis (AarF/ABC1/UbiB family)